MTNTISNKNIQKEIEQIQAKHAVFEQQLQKQLYALKSSGSTQAIKQWQLRESEELFRATFNHAAIGIAHVELSTGRWIRVNKRFCEIAGWSEKELLKQTFLDTTHPDDHKRDLELIDDVMQRKVSAIHMEKRYVRKDGSSRWVYATASIIRDPSGEPKYGIAIVEDIHNKKVAEDKLKVLEEASRVLTSSLNYNETLSSVAHLMVPQFADWCQIDILAEDGSFKRVKVVHANVKDKQLAETIHKNAPITHASGCMTHKAVSLRKSILVPRVNSKTKRACSATSEVLHKAVATIKQKSFMIVPLIARDKVLGVMILRSTQVSRKYSEKDVAFMEQIAGRAALAVDNARLYAEAQKAVQVRDDFLSIASHELKTSLTTIKVLAQILERGYVKEQDKHSTTLLHKMDTQLNRTTKLINDLLDVSKIQSGKIVVRKELLDVDVFLEDIVENCQRLANGHKIILKTNITEKMHVDRGHMNQIMTNLVVNAMKYSPGAERVVLSAAKNKDNIVISVKDFGIGIVRERQQKIFERFFRVDSDMKGKVSGLGLGLFIVRKLVEQNGGEIWVKSEVGKGSTFYLSFPLNNIDTKEKSTVLMRKAH